MIAARRVAHTGWADAARRLHAAGEDRVDSSHGSRFDDTESVASGDVWYSISCERSTAIASGSGSVPLRRLCFRALSRTQ